MITAALTAIGIGLASGQRGALTVLAIGGAHYTPWFELGERWLWLASPPVLVIVGAVAIAEILADRYPTSSELVDFASWLPRAIVAAVATAAAFGQVDPSIVTLAASGLLGASVAIGTDRLRATSRQTTRDLADSGAPAADRVAHHTETASAAALTLTAITQPWLIILVTVATFALFALALLLARAARSGAARWAGLDNGEDSDPVGE